MMLAIAFPGPLEILILLILFAVPAAVVLLVVRGKKSGQPPRAAFPVVLTAEADGAGTYRVVGVDKNTRGDRELTIDAASRANAQVKAELDGIIVTSVTKTTK
jgi:hypothetical protein